MTHHLPSPLLVVEASTTAGSVALIVDGVVAAERSLRMGPSRDDALLPAIAGVLKDAHIAPHEIRAIACGSGPGSFTSLRIAASLCKGLSVANDAPLYAIPSLLLAAATLTSTPGRYVLHAEALRSERYVVRVEVMANGALAMSSVSRVPLDGLELLAADENATLLSVGAADNPREKNGLTEGSVTERSVTESVATDSTFPTVRVLQPHARNVVFLASMWNTFGPIPIETWEPDYGRLAEAQVKWEFTHGRALPAG
ncbi:MAG: tRNA (adenosine(37)-N6)-threonylcarbamoyltransferase complex dimerization subunit type 1 TsaB [Gemmatimonas sp.]